MNVYYAIPEKLPAVQARFLQIMNTAHALARAGAEVKLLTAFRPGAGPEDILAHYGLPADPNLEIVGLPMLRRDQASWLRVSWHGVFQAALLKYLFTRRRRGGVVFVRHLKLASFLLRWKSPLGLPVVYEAHEIFHRTADSPRGQKRLAPLEIRTARKADAVVCTSSVLAQEFQDLGAADPQVTPHGVREEWFEVNRTLGGPVIYTGGLYPWKGVDDLLEAAVMLPGQRFLIVGGGDRLDYLQDAADRLGLGGRVDFVGRVPHESIPVFLGEAGLAVLPNRPGPDTRYSAPLKLVEYMAAGLPLVAADVPTFREILVDERNALLFEPGHAADLAAALNRLIVDPALAANLGRRARNQAAQYTYARRAERLIDLFGSVLSR